MSCPCGLTRGNLDANPQFVNENQECITRYKVNGAIQVCGELYSSHPSAQAAARTDPAPDGEVMAELRGLRSDLAAQETRRIRKALDCWVSNNRTKVESAEFKKTVIDFYDRREVTDTDTGKIISARCMISGGVHTYTDLCPAHLVKHCKPELMTLYGLSQSDIDNPRNGILILKELELAFDRKTVCFLRNPITGELIFRVLDPSLLDKRIHLTSLHEIRTFGDMNGGVLQHPTEKIPFRRILSMHAKLSLSRALCYDWIDNKEEIDTYYSVSESDLEEPECIRGLTWKEMNYKEIEGLIIY